MFAMTGGLLRVHKNVGYLEKVCIHLSLGLGSLWRKGHVFLRCTGNTDNVSYSILQYAILCYAMYTIQWHKLIYCEPYCVQVQHLNN